MMHNANIYKVLVVEDEPKIQRNVIQKIERVSSSFKVVGKAANGEEAFILVDSLKPDLLITDIRMPKVDGLELIEKVKKDNPELHVIILSGYDEFQYAQRAIKLGVTDYLLKPVEESELEEILNEVKGQLDNNKKIFEKKILTSSIHGQTDNSELPYMFEHAAFYLFLICIGNFYESISPDELHRHYEKIWGKMELDIIGEELNEEGKWWLIDEKHPNQKFFLLFLPDISEENKEKLPKVLMQMLQQQVQVENVSICFEENGIPYHDIWSLSQKLRGFMQSGVTIGKSMLITERVVAAYEKLPPLLTSATLDRLTFLIQSDNSKLFKKELEKLFESWEKETYPQKVLKAGLLQLIRHCYTKAGMMSNTELNDIEKHLNKLCAEAITQESVFRGTCNLLEDMFEPQKNEGNADDLAERISVYIQRNFSEDITLEGIARKFGISISYIIKIFKKYHNQTLLQYVINMRIAEAKRLMRENPNIDIKDVGELVGYGDQHYFSRVFKNTTGMSPSEYREQS